MKRHTHLSLWFPMALIVLLLSTAWAPLPQTDDGTEDPSAILISQLHVLIITSEDYLEIREIYIISNAGAETYIGTEDPNTGQRRTLVFNLPDGAENLAFADPEIEERFIVEGSALYDTAPVLADSGTTEVVFSYALPYQEGSQVERTFSYPVIDLTLLPMGEFGLEGPTLEIKTSEGIVYYDAGSLEAGVPLLFTLTAAPASLQMPPSRGGNTSPVPTTPTTPPPNNTLQGAGIGFAVLAIAALVTYLLWRSSTPPPLPARARPLVRRIAKLDIDYEEGQIDKEPYDRKRKALKQEILALLETNEQAPS